MNEVERVKTICKERKIPISRLEKECGFCNGYIGQLKKGVFPSDRLLKVAAYLGVPLSDLSSTAADLSYVSETNDIKVDVEIVQALSGPYRDHLLAYAKKLNELRNMDEVEQLSESPVNKFRRLRANGLQNPMTDDEIDDFVASVRKERHDSSN